MLSLNLNTLLKPSSIKTVKLTSFLANGNVETDMSGWSVLAGTIVASADYSKTGAKSAKAFGATSQAVQQNFTATTGDKIYVCGFVKCTRRVQGDVGIRLRLNGVSYLAAITSVQDWTFVSVLQDFTNSGIIDLGTFNSANADGYIDPVLAFNVSDSFKNSAGFTPTKAKIDTVLQSKIAAEGYKTEYKFKLSEFK